MTSLRRLVRELHRRSIWQVLGIYGAGGWVVLQVVDNLTDSAGLPDWVPPFALVLLLIGLPIVLATAFVQEGLPGADPAPASPPAVGAPFGQPAGGRADERAAHHRLFTWRNAVLGGLGAFALLGIAVGAYFLMRATGKGPWAGLVAQGLLDARDPIVLADFENSSSDPTAGDLVTEALRVDLLDSRFVVLVPPARVQEVLALMRRDAATVLNAEVAREVAQREGLKAVIQGEVTSAGRGYVLTAAVVAAETGDLLAGFRETAHTGDELVDAIDRLSGRIRERVGENLRTIRAGEPLMAVTTSSVAALRKLTEAQKLSDRGDIAAAIALLQEAVEIDTAFAMAWRKLSILEGNRPTPGSPARVREAARRAYQHRDRLTELERHLAAAQYHSVVEVEPEAAIRDYLSALRVDPDDPTALNNLGLRYQQRGRYAEAGELLERALRSRYGAPAVAYMNRALNYIFLARFDSARALVERFEQVFPAHPGAMRTRLDIETIDGDSAAAHLAAERLAESQNAVVGGRAAALAAAAGVDAAAGRVRESRRHIAEAIRYAEISDAPNVALTWAGNEVDFLTALGDSAAARQRMRDFLAQRWGRGGRPWAPTIQRLAYTGLLAEARAYFDRWPTEVPDSVRGPNYELNRKQAFAAIQHVSGDLEAALAAYRELMGQRPCVRCYRFEMADIEARRGRIQEAIALLEKMVEEPADPGRFAFDRVIALEKLGYLYEQGGDTAKAAVAYGRFAEAWKNADPELQPRVSAALARAERVVGEAARR
jgi:tetratricopeptide (TPR) repeat protein